MKNMRRLQFELAALKGRYGSHNVVAPSNIEWVKIAGVPLPRGMYNLDECTVLIVVPKQFDVVSISECYVDADLRMRGTFGLQDLPHVHGSGYESQGYRWLCFHQPGKSGFGLLDFLKTLRSYFTDPDGYVKANEEV